MNTRKGMGKGLGTGYKNIAPMDAHIHSLSAKGVVTYKKTKSGGDVRIGTNKDGTKNYLFFPTSAYGHERPHQIRTVLKKLGLNAKGEVYDNVEKKDSGVSIVKGVNGYRIENDKGKILFDKVFNDQLEAFAYYRQNRYTLKAMFSIYGQKWKVLDKNKRTVLLKNKKGETLTITRDEYEQYKPKRYSVQEMIESVVNAKGKKKDKEFERLANKVFGKDKDLPDEPSFSKKKKQLDFQEWDLDPHLEAKGRNVKYKMSKEEKEMLAKETPYLKILRNTFKRMANKENWKLPPKPFVTKSYPLALQIENTYNHFLGGSEMTALSDGTYKVTSKGYYHYIGA